MVAPALLTPAERAFFAVLQEAISRDCYLFAKVRLADIIEVERGLAEKRRYAAFGRISAKPDPAGDGATLLLSRRIARTGAGGFCESRVRRKNPQQITVHAVLNQQQTTQQKQNIVKKTQLLIAAATLSFALLPGEKALAQTPGGADLQGMSPQDLQNRIKEFQNMNPQQRQAALQQFQNMDPQQMMNIAQQFINTSLRERMAVPNDAEWSVIEVKINAVTKARMSLMADGGGMMGMGMGGMRGGGSGGLQAMFGQRSSEAQALQQAIDSDAPAAQMRSLLDKYRAVRKEKQAALVKAQDELRTVLTVRQEAIATLGSLLD